MNINIVLKKKIKIKKYYTVGTIQEFNRISRETYAKSISVTNTTLFPDLVRVL
jgi:hypothetical protein